MSECMNGPSNATRTTNEGRYSGGTTSEAQSQEETQMQTETATETVTEAPTTETPPPNGSVQYNEDGNTICEEDFDPDSGCEANETNDGSGSGFSIPDDVVLNITLQPVLKPMPIRTLNLTYAGPLSSDGERFW